MQKHGKKYVPGHGKNIFLNNFNNKAALIIL